MQRAGGMVSTRSRVSSAVARVAVLLAASVALASGGCHLPPRSADAVAPATGGGTLITEVEISRMSARTAWDVVRLRAPRFTVGVDASGQPSRVRIQEPHSVNADETPLLVVDGMQASDFDYLKQIPASDVHSIRILRGEAAQPLYGLRAAGGAIVVETKRRTSGR
jgi:outer membrane cobalamin receptor